MSPPWGIRPYYELSRGTYTLYDVACFVDHVLLLLYPSLLFPGQVMVPQLEEGIGGNAAHDDESQVAVYVNLRFL